MAERRISHYRILGKLGEGGMGQVFLAEDTRLERRTALKLLPPRFASDPERLARFRREAKTVASLNHPNIVTIYSVEEADDGPFLTMELVEGQALDRAIPSDGLPLKEFFEIALPLADALSAAHAKGVTHRDLKPSNVMIGNDRRVKILDFGLAKLLEQEPEHAGAPGHRSLDLSNGRIMGTVPYMSPEQLSGSPADHRSDIFSLGIVLFEMATGRRPFRGVSSAEVISSILREDPRPITAFKAELPRHLGRIIRLCLEKDPRDRFHSAVDVRNVLRGLMVELGMFPGVVSGETSGPVVADRPDRSFSPAKFELRHLVTTRVGLALVLGLVALANWVETAAENLARAGPALAGRFTDPIARAMQWLEPGVSFEHHDATNMLAVYGNSVSYFFVFPLLGLGTALTLARRREITPFRVFCLAVVLVYLISLPFFLLFPVPERWSFPGSEATLLSDLWSSRLVETVRPISGLNNCFPSFHVSLTVVIVLCCYLFRVRLRTTVLCLGLTVVLSTFVLGIHWTADIAAGLATGILGVALARRLDGALHGTGGGIQQRDPT